VMLETIREYAAERLAADTTYSAAARRAHAAHFAGFTQSLLERLTGSGRDEAIEELGADIENVRTAWRYWVDERDLEQLGKFVASLWLFYDARGWYRATIDLMADMLNVLASFPPSPERAQQQVLLQTSLARAQLAAQGYTAEVEQAYMRALDLAAEVGRETGREAGELPQLFPVLRGLASYYVFRGEFEKAAQMGEKILELAERLDDASMSVEGQLVLGYNLAFLNHINQGMDHLEAARASYDPDRFRRRGFALGSDPGVVCLSVSALLLWMQGRPDRARERANAAQALAARLNHPFSAAYAQFHASLLHLWMRDAEAARTSARAVLDIADEYEFESWTAVATCLHGAALTALGRAEEGLAQVQRGLDLYQRLNTPPVFWPLLLYVQAEAAGHAGRADYGLAALERALQFGSQNSGDNIFLPDLFRLKGDLLLAPSADHAPEREAEAEAWLQRAMALARELQVQMPELRAAIGLCRLWQRQGRAEQGVQMLGEVYAKFGEGFATADLVEARTLLGR
jgi:tetratricopeptide (TPR) repeat protein